MKTLLALLLFASVSVFAGERTFFSKEELKVIESCYPKSTDPVVLKQRELDLLNMEFKRRAFFLENWKTLATASRDDLTYYNYFQKALEKDKEVRANGLSKRAEWASIDDQIKKEKSGTQKEYLRKKAARLDAEYKEAIKITKETDEEYKNKKSEYKKIVEQKQVETKADIERVQKELEELKKAKN